MTVPTTQVHTPPAFGGVTRAARGLRGPWRRLDPLAPRAPARPLRLERPFRPLISRRCAGEEGAPGGVGLPLSLLALPGGHRNPGQAPKPTTSLSLPQPHFGAQASRLRGASNTVQQTDPGCVQTRRWAHAWPWGWEPSGAGRAASAGAPELGALCCWDSDGPAGAAALGSAPWLGVGGLSGDSPGSVLSLGIQPCCVCRCPGATPTSRACTACGLVHKHLCGVKVSLLLLFCQVKMRESGLGEAADRPRLTRLWSLPMPGRPASSPPRPPRPPPTAG